MTKPDGMSTHTITPHEAAPEPHDFAPFSREFVIVASETGDILWTDARAVSQFGARVGTTSG